MNDFKPITYTDEFIKKYWDGPGNLLVRYQIYLQRGLMLFNETKNYILLLFGSYWTVKTMDWWNRTGIPDNWLLIIVGILATIGIGIILLLGRWHLYKAAKSTEFITGRHGTLTQFNSYNMQVRQIELLEEILKELKEYYHENS